VNYWIPTIIVLWFLTMLAIWIGKAAVEIVKDERGRRNPPGGGGS
jgi:hypothetical protein